MKRLFIIFMLFFPVFTLATDVATPEQSHSDSSDSEESDHSDHDSDGDIPMVDLPKPEELEHACRQFCGESTWQEFWNICQDSRRTMHAYFTTCLRDRTTLKAPEKNAIEVLLRALTRSQVE